MVIKIESQNSHMTLSLIIIKFFIAFSYIIIKKGKKKFTLLISYAFTFRAKITLQ